MSEIRICERLPHCGAILVRRNRKTIVSRGCGGGNRKSSTNNSALKHNNGSK